VVENVFASQKRASARLILTNIKNIKGCNIPSVRGTPGMRSKSKPTVRSTAYQNTAYPVATKAE
jgi:hypothetical protein